MLLLSAECFKIYFFKKFFQEHYQSVKQFGSKSGLTFCWSWSWSRLFAKAISRQQCHPRKRVKTINPNQVFIWCGFNITKISLLLKYPTMEKLGYHIFQQKNKQLGGVQKKLVSWLYERQMNRLFRILLHKSWFRDPKWNNLPFNYW